MSADTGVKYYRLGPAVTEVIQKMPAEIRYTGIAAAVNPTTGLLKLNDNNIVEHINFLLGGSPSH